MNKTSLLMAITIAIFLYSTGCIPQQTAPSPAPAVDLIATGVKATIDAMTVPKPAESTPELVQTAAADPETAILPHSVYYLAKDNTGIEQVWRLENDGATTVQLTFSDSDVTFYSISAKTGLLAFVSANDLFIQTTPGERAIKILDAEVDDGDGVWFAEKAISFPAWSNDGSMLAFGLNGLNIYTPSDGSVIKVIANKFRGEDPKLVDEMYYPLSWSPDDSQILLGISYYESGSSGVFTLAEGSMMKLERSDGYCACGISTWDPAGGRLVMAGFAYAANTSEIWEYSTKAQGSSRLLPEKDPSGSYNYVKFPLIVNNEIYFLYAKAGDQADDNELTRLVKAPRNDLSNMTVLRSDEQLLQEALWTEDGSLLVAISAPPSFEYPLHGSLLLLTMNDLPAQTLVKDAREIQWGP